MAGEDKRGPRERAEPKLDRQGKNAEADESKAEYKQTRYGVIKKMDMRNRQDTATVDRWFDRQLNQLYSEVISEPLPKEFVELIEKLRDKTPK